MSQSSLKEQQHTKKKSFKTVPSNYNVQIIQTMTYGA
jgi:hypothetical protein